MGFKTDTPAVTPKFDDALDQIFSDFAPEHKLGTIGRMHIRALAGGAGGGASGGCWGGLAQKLAQSPGQTRYLTSPVPRPPIGRRGGGGGGRVRAAFPIGRHTA